MDIHVASIREKNFSISLRGYNKKEVKEFIDEVAQTLETLINKNEKLSQEITQFKQKLDDYRLKEESVHTLIESTRAQTDLQIKQSEEKANLIIKEAEIAAEKIQQQEKKKLEKLQIEIKRLLHQRKLLIEKFKTFLQAQAELLKFFEEENSLSANSVPTLTFFSNKSLKKVTFEEED